MHIEHKHLCTLLIIIPKKTQRASRPHRSCQRIIFPMDKFTVFPAQHGAERLQAPAYFRLACYIPRIVERLVHVPVAAWWKLLAQQQHIQRHQRPQMAVLLTAEPDNYAGGLLGGFIAEIGRLNELGHLLLHLRHGAVAHGFFLGIEAADALLLIHGVFP